MEEISIYNNLSKENSNKIKIDNNIEIKSINSQDKGTENKSLESSNKFCNFIKTKPFLFLLILLGVLSVIAICITLPLVLIKKNKSNEIPSSNNQNEVPFIEIDSAKQIDFNNNNNDNINNIYNSIGEKNNDLTDCCTSLSEISSDINDKEKVYAIYKWICNNIRYDSGNIEPQDVLTNKKGSYSGYANLFTKLLTCLNFPAERKY